MTERSSRRVLVTGGAGFLGSHLCERLLGQGDEVICLDSFRTGARRNIEHLLADPGFRLVRHDVTEPVEATADEIYNLACPASPAHYQEDPVFTMKTSVLGALNLLELARRTGARILQASTSEVYGDPLAHPQPETYWGNVNPTGVRACYDEGKRAAETLFFDYHRRHGVLIKVARIFNTYGPRMHQNDGRIVSNFVVQALDGQPITVYGTGSQTRSLCYVSDMVDALVALMRSDGAVTGPVNLGNPVETRVIEIARLVKRMTGSASRIVHRPLPSDDPRRRRPDIAYAREVLGWQPRVPLETGLRETIAHFRARLAGQPAAAKPALVPHPTAASASAA